MVGITGASGSLLADRFLLALLRLGHRADVVWSPGGLAVWRQELGSEPDPKRYRAGRRLTVSASDDFTARVSSGSARADAMVVIPCSMSTVASIATGLTLNLIHRAASVALKEKRPLILVPRESPLSPVHLKNLQYLSEIGVHIVPATTAFYHRPASVEAMVDFTVGRVLDLLKIEHRLFPRWREEAAGE